MVIELTGVQFWSEIIQVIWNYKYNFRPKLHNTKFNRPLLSSKNPHFQNEAKCTMLIVKMSFICMRIKNDFLKGWAPIPLFWSRCSGELGNGLLPLYYSHFKITEFSQYQYFNDQVVGLLKSKNKKASTSSGGSRGEVQGAHPPVLFLDQTETWRAEKNLFWDRPHPPYLGVWMAAPPYLKVWICHWHLILYLKQKWCDIEQKWCDLKQKWSDLEWMTSFRTEFDLEQKVVSVVN